MREPKRIDELAMLGRMAQVMNLHAPNRRWEGRRGRILAVGSFHRVAAIETRPDPIIIAPIDEDGQVALLELLPDGVNEVQHPSRAWFDLVALSVEPITLADGDPGIDRKLYDVAAELVGVVALVHDHHFREHVGRTGIVLHAEPLIQFAAATGLNPRAGIGCRVLLLPWDDLKRTEIIQCMASQLVATVDSALPAITRQNLAVALTLMMVEHERAERLQRRLAAMDEAFESFQVRMRRAREGLR